jgi:hypothetical protein
MKLKIGNDTIIGITVDQLKAANVKFAYSHFLEEQNDQLGQKIDEILNLSLSKDSLIDDKNSVILKLNRVNESTIEEVNKANESIKFLTTDRDKYKSKSKTFFYTTISLGILSILLIL